VIACARAPVLWQPHLIDHFEPQGKIGEGGEGRETCGEHQPPPVPRKDKRGQSKWQEDEHNGEADSRHLHTVTMRIGVFEDEDSEKNEEGNFRRTDEQRARAKPLVADRQGFAHRGHRVCPSLIKVGSGEPKDHRTSCCDALRYGGARIQPPNLAQFLPEICGILRKVTAGHLEPPPRGKSLRRGSDKADNDHDAAGIKHELASHGIRPFDRSSNKQRLPDET